MAETIGLTMLACVVVALIVASGFPRRGTRSLRARLLAAWIRRRG